MEKETLIGGPGRPFPTTRWSIVIAARGEGEARRVSLEALLADYWKPLYLHLRRGGLGVDDAKDAVQGFVAHLLEHDSLERVDPSKGRFRSWLRASLDNWMRNRHASDVAEKRGGGRKIVSLDVESAERALREAPGDAASAFDREWALGVMERALITLRAEFAAGKREGPLDVALRFFGFGEPCSYAQAAAEAATTVPLFKAFLHRTRTRFREIVRDEVAHTVGDDGDVDAEIAELMHALGRAG